MAAAALVSCSREPLSIAPAEEFGPNTIAFTLQETPGTRAGGLISTTNISLGTTESGEPIYLQERVTRLGGLSRVPATKAALATTDNVDRLYSEFIAMIYDENGDPFLIDESTDGRYVFPYEGNHRKWAKSFGTNPLAVSSPLTFIMAMPEPEGGFGLNADGKIAFSYNTPEAFDEQADLLIAGVELTADSYKPAEGFAVEFKHALTGVKFAIGNTASGTKITSVTLTGIKNSGSALAKADGTEISWNTEGSATEEYSMAFPDGEYAEGDDLNDDDLSYTFWFVPQTLSDDATITVSYSVGSGDKAKQESLTVNINEALGGTVTWLAGELHTFTLNPMMVDVGIEDTMDPTQTIKSDVVITNTGNIAQFVRVNLIGNWVGERMISENKWSDETVLMGYTDATMEYEVARWNDKDGAHQWVSPTGRSYNYVPFGVFSGLPAKNATVNNWIRRDKYYYYTLAVDPEAPIEDELFESYTLEVDNIPDIYIRDNAGTPQKARNVHLVLDVVVQAVSAIDANGNTYDTYEAAWKAALGESANLDDL